VHETHPVSAAPYDILVLAQQRQQARVEQDWATSDALRDQIAAEGWIVKDTSDGFTLEAKPPYEVHAKAAALPNRNMPTTQAACVGLIVEGWPDDIRTFIESVLTHTQFPVIALDLGNIDGAGDAVHALTVEHPDRVEAFHLSGSIGWAEATMALLQLNPTPIHIVADPSSVLDGDALTPLISALDDKSVVAAGWRGANVDVSDGWRSVSDAGPGEVDVLLSYLFAVRRDAAIAAPPHPKARFYRNADLEWSLALREAGGRLVVPAMDLPVHQERHRGYHDSDAQMRDKESRKTYDRLLQRFRGKDHLLAPRPATDTSAP
jgi:hypothetical protein